MASAPGARDRDDEGPVTTGTHVVPAEEATRTAESPARSVGTAARPGFGWLFLLTKIVLLPVVQVWFRPQVRGRENVPASGPVLIAGNHTSYLDWFLLPTALWRRQIVFLAKSEYFTGRGVRGRAQRFFFTACGQVSVDRSGADAATAAITTAVGLLHEGRTVGIYPEGTRTRDGGLARGRTGVARIAAASCAPVVPVAIVGLFRACPPGRRIPRPVRVQVRFGPPLPPVTTGGEPVAADLRAWTDLLMARIAGLAGECGQPKGGD